MRTRIAAALAAISTLAGCGYIGEPLPPALNIPVAVADLRVIEYGDSLLIEFTAPEMSTEGIKLSALRGVDLRVGPTEPNFNVDRWAQTARKVDAEVAAPGSVRKEIPARDFVDKEVVVAVRAIGPKGRAGAWSNLATLRIVEPLLAPSSITAIATADGVRVSWSSAYSAFRLFRGTRDEAPAPLAEISEPTFMDTSALFDTPYRYFVQAISDRTQSRVSETVTVTPVDVFPPAVPAGLTAFPGSGSVELTWERNTEADFRGYRVYRALEAGAFVQLGGVTDTPTFSDKTVEPGKKYRYAVSSLDLKGNESKQSQPVDVVAPEKP